MPPLMKSLRVVLTLLVAALGIGAGIYVWHAYVDTPWTRDGRVRTRIVQMTPDVSGAVTDLRVTDNQPVAKGDLMFVIDPARYQLAVAQAEATVAGLRSDLDQRRKEAARRDRLTSTAITDEAREQAQTLASSAEAALRQGEVALDVARLNLARTQIRSPVNGYVTNLLLDVGDYATAGKAAIAVVDRDGFFVAGYFEETKLAQIHIGDPAIVRLMGLDQDLTGKVQSITRAIVDRDNTASGDLIANINPSFTWVRLAQRIPVRIKLDPLPAGIDLTSGQTATIVIRPERHADPK